MMNARQLAKVLAKVPHGANVDGQPIPKGWHLAMNQQYVTEGTMRIQYFTEA